MKKVEQQRGCRCCQQSEHGPDVARFGRLVPVVGGVVAGGFDAADDQTVGRTATGVHRP